MTHITVVPGLLSPSFPDSYHHRSRILIIVIPAPSGAGTHLVVCVSTPDGFLLPKGTGMTVGIAWISKLLL